MDKTMHHLKIKAGWIASTWEKNRLSSSLKWLNTQECLSFLACLFACCQKCLNPPHLRLEKMIFEGPFQSDAFFESMKYQRVSNWSKLLSKAWMYLQLLLSWEKCFSPHQGYTYQPSKLTAKTWMNTTNSQQPACLYFLFLCLGLSSVQIWEAPGACAWGEPRKAPSLGSVQCVAVLRLHRG